MNSMVGNFVNCSGRYVLVAGKFNHFITDKLVQGAEAVLVAHGIDQDQTDCVWVPGAFEIPQIARKLVSTEKYSAVITLGAVIRGATAHFDFVAGECVKGIAELNRQTTIPVIFGVLTVDNIEQAIERAGTKCGNKGGEAALAALEMVSVMRQIDAAN